MGTLEYFKYILRHKYYVGLECFKVGLYWRGIVHDLSKFHPKEFFPYRDKFFGEFSDVREGRKKTSSQVKRDFQRALNRHLNKNSHHWQHYVMKKDTEDVVLEMSQRDLLEMLCDWKGMSRTMGNGNTREWYLENKDKMMLHPHTRLLVEIDLEAL